MLNLIDNAFFYTTSEKCVLLKNIIRNNNNCDISKYEILFFQFKVIYYF